MKYVATQRFRGNGTDWEAGSEIPASEFLKWQNRLLLIEHHYVAIVPDEAETRPAAEENRETTSEVGAASGNAAAETAEEAMGETGESNSDNEPADAPQDLSPEAIEELLNEKQVGGGWYQLAPNEPRIRGREAARSRLLEILAASKTE